MQYMGGKSRIAKKIDAALPKGGHFWDPFCGGLSMAAAMGRTRTGVVSDVKV